MKTAHTGQVQDEDYRKTRFVGRQKDVNENFAIGLIAEQPLTEAESPEVVCDSSGVALGPPEVYINRDKEAKTGTCAPGDCRSDSTITRAGRAPRSRAVHASISVATENRRGHLGGSVAGASIRSQGREFKPHIGLHAGCGAYLIN